MPDLSKFSFRESPVNVAIEDILRFSRQWQDQKKTVVLTDCDYGWVAPEGKPQEDEVPMQRIWCETGIGKMDNNANLRSEGKYQLSLLFYFFAFGEETGVPNGNIQAQRQRLIDHFIDDLSKQETLDSFDENSWRIDFDDDFVIDHNNALKKINQYVQLNPPWYVTRLDIKIEVFYEFIP